MLRTLVLGTCLAVTVAGCIQTPHPRTTKAVNTALTAGCLAARLSPCTIEPSHTEKARLRGQGSRRPRQRATRFERRRSGRRAPLIVPDGYRTAATSQFEPVRRLWKPLQSRGCRKSNVLVAHMGRIGMLPLPSAITRARC